MLELGIFCVILLAAGYWATMFIMGRRDDVIHGKFVHTEDEGEFTPAAMPAPPPFPKRPVNAAQTAGQTPVPASKPVNSQALQSLLAAIQQDLKSVA
ncbi:hypothetical protein HZZ13_03775 [Bradyrhizobium sp. CNPSo 4010]|uniref:Uncharacterized protein n=1 Tax=Bradyrhizobium agreste TaxID=2751811 RepID=A0ABS0PIY4_9BRAD|nr:hypothetical protein [Bradyrhizobium agreste]MBH5396911.1 hypothetical protein [Bradyrhizobium agreste]